MTRSEAIAPLNPGEARFPVEVGLLTRGTVRRVCAMQCVDFYEEKGLLESTFIVRGPIARVQATLKALKRMA
jgi:hypothetical protein